MSDSANSAIISYLNTEVSAGRIEKYEYEAGYSGVTVYLAGEEIPYYIELGDFVLEALKVSSSNNGAEYSQMIGDSVRGFLEMNYVLIINDKTDFLDESNLIYSDTESLTSDLSILIEVSLNKEEKIAKLTESIVFPDESSSSGSGGGSGIVNLFASLLGKVKGITGNAISGNAVSPSNSLASASNQEIADYIASDEDVIVPVGREISLFFGPDIKQTNKKLSEALSTYTKNKYFSTLYSSQEANLIDKFAEVMKNPKKDIIILNAHGNVNPSKILMEKYTIYEFNKGWTDEKADEAEMKFNLRVDELYKKYGRESITKRVSENSLDEYGYIYINPSFFVRNDFPKKSVFLLISCMNGENFSKTVDSRVFAGSQAYKDTSGIVVRYDLEKVDSLLYKNIPVNLKDNIISEENNRNYRGASLFGEKYAEGVYSWLLPFFRKTQACLKNDSLLCNLKFYSGIKEGNKTVAVSPHVKEISSDSEGERIVFNAPMDISTPAYSVVQVDGSKCENFKYSAKNNVWKSDKEILLPKLYGGIIKPGDKLVKITVMNDKATSKYSNVRLTGNSDCCDNNGCKTQECYGNPTKIEFNGNIPSSDFVFYLPCPEKEEPNLTICQQNGGSYDRKYEEYYTETDGSCVLFEATETYDCEGNQIGFYSQNLPVPNEVCLQRGSCVAVNANEKEDVSLCLTLTTKTQCDKAEVCQWVKPGEALA
jgi:hypothetical protein